MYQVLEDYNLNVGELLSNCNKMLPEEVALLIDLTVKTNAQIILEIGSGWKCSASTVAFGIGCKETGGRVFTVDPRHHEDWDAHIEKYGVTDYVTKFVGKSPWFSSNNYPNIWVEGNIGLDKEDGVGNIDILLIDGDHDPLAVVTDFHYRERFVRPGGFFVFHDYNESPTGKGGKRALRLIRDHRHLVEVARVNVEAIKGMVIFQKNWE